MKAATIAVLGLFAAHFVSVQLRAAETLTVDQEEDFLKKAKIVKTKSSKKGVTETVIVTLSDGKFTHDASVQRIAESKPVFETPDGSTELNFRDQFSYNIAAWKIARLLGLDDMVPPSVDRNYMGSSASFTWWIDGIQMDEADRLSKKIEPPDRDAFNREIQVMHVFDALIYNVDSNATNLLYDTQWHAWFIDHTRSFRLAKQIRDPKMLTTCDRQLLAKMKALNVATLTEQTKKYLNHAEVDAVLARRDLLVKYFDSKGESVLYDRPSRH